MGNKRVGFKQEQYRIIKNILNWYEGKEKYLNIISPPYNSCEIFIDIILKSAAIGEKILYLTNEKSSCRIIENIKANTDFKNYTYIKENSYYNNSNLVVCNFECVEKIKSKFNLIIYDDISSISEHDRVMMKEILDTHCCENGKIIFYSIESVEKGYKELVFSIRKNEKPIIEPRLIITRIDINKDIPYVVYEYLNWSITLNKKIIIYVPNEEKVKNVYMYLYKLKSKLSRNIEYFIKEKSNKKVLTNFLKRKRSILITNYLGEENLSFKDINIMVYFADDKIFDYKKLVFLSNRVGNFKEIHKGEVILLANEETDDIAMAKNITRGFNKELWEIGLFSI
ncbi:hypothetical protein ACFIJ5_15500 [Haloimpatiens sp. FM7330]|uniref:hypothetical protein n=1 Tax=Haloimpatiens sp. FM7330 TaxID=3298610 RepID=UPI00363EB083